jgi:hypothetical protein
MALPCLACGGDTAADGWCARCLTMPAPPDPDRAVRMTPAVATTLPVTRRKGAKSEITFGPLGRTLWTMGIVVVPVPFLVFSDGLAGWGLAGMWWGVITPWSMRDLWRRYKA